jgi:hypothetical protein
MAKFILEIELGNDGACTGYDVAHMIRDVAFVMQDHGNLTQLKYRVISKTPIKDINGNVVGKYGVI